MELDKTEEDDSPSYPPVTITGMGIPNERFLRMAYKTYTPSDLVLRLKSEENRTIFAEVFIENNQLGPLSDLCVRALAKVYPPDQILPAILEDHQKRRIYFDSLPLDMPIEAIYKVEDKLYWRRIVLAKSKVKSLAFKNSYDWKSLAISIKFVELIESYKAEYFPTEYIKELSLKIKDYVKEMHIRQLQTMEERSFEQYFENESETATDTETESVTITSSDGSLRSQRSFSVTFGMTEEEIHQAKEETAARAAKRIERRSLKEAQIKRREARAERRLRKHPPPPPPQTKRKRKFRPKGVFDIPLELEEEEEPRGVDRRDQLRLYNIKRKREYKPEFSHHVDLRFLQYFENMTVFTIEFQGPELAREYHTKHFNFSYDDMMNLAHGLKFLSKLQVFRLRNSRMDARKLHIIVDVLKDLEKLEIIDFGYDQLQDDCGPDFHLLFENMTSIRELELEANAIGVQVMQNLAAGLLTYKGHLEYLGLGASYMDEVALHELTSRICGSPQITHLCLKGTMLSSMTLKCCIAGELLTRHTELKRLDMRGVRINPLAAVDMIQALRTNLSILRIDCRGCGLNETIEADFEVVCHRNNYLQQNPYIGKKKMTEEQIRNFASREKNPILIAAKEAVRKRQKCMKERVRESVIVPTPVPSYVDTHRSYASVILPEHIDYDPNGFNEQEFHEHVLIPGPGERYYFFQQMRVGSNIV